eukprot:scaffold3690_cov113-Isochrysis_galbana.AAC.7
MPGGTKRGRGSGAQTRGGTGSGRRHPLAAQGRGGVQRRAYCRQGGTDIARRVAVGGARGVPAH